MMGQAFVVPNAFGLWEVYTSGGRLYGSATTEELDGADMNEMDAIDITFNYQIRLPVPLELRRTMGYQIWLYTDRGVVDNDRI